MLGATIYTSCELLTDWSARQADNAILFAEEIDISAADGTISLTIQVFHKGLGETGDGTAVGAPIVLDGGASRFKHTRVEGLEQLVRLKLSAVGQSDAGYVFGWVHYRVLDPIWYDSARPSA